MGSAARKKTMDTAVSSKTERQRARTENILYGSHHFGAKKQQNRRPVLDETLRAEVFLTLCFVASRSQIHENMLPRRFAHKAKNPLSVGIHNFLTSCYGNSWTR
jgi:hypothetical protein